jgi:hypothetical protein
MAYDNNPDGQAQYDAMVNAIAAANSDAENAQMRIEYCNAQGDHAGAAEAYRQLARAEARLNTLEAGKQGYDDDEAARMNQQAQQRPISAKDVIQSLNLMPTEAEWAGKLHPDWVTTPKGQELLRSAYNLTERAGLRRGTPEFLAEMEKRLGLPSSANHGLSKAQLEHAKWSNVSAETYAENARKLAHLKSLGYYTNN